MVGKLKLEAGCKLCMARKSWMITPETYKKEHLLGNFASVVS
jgi:hypothetical protein